MQHKTMSTLGLALATTALVAIPASAQSPATDSRWLPFVGCWEAVGGEDEMGLLCFEQDGQGVRLTNYVDGEAASTERMIADGSRQDVSAEGCEGWETVQFSEDGRRAFTNTEFVCGDEARTGTGVMAFIAPNQWADIRTLESGDEPFAWVQQYRLAGRDRLAEAGVEDPARNLGMAVRLARASAAGDLTLDDVREASARMDPKAVESWLVAKGDGFDPSAQDLLELSEAGVSEAVIDAVVAVSNPDRFLVQAGAPPEQADAMPRPRTYRGYMGFNPFWGPAWGVPLSYRYGYSPYGYGYGYGLPYYGSGYGYGYGYYGYRPGYVVIGRRPSGTVYKGSGFRPSSSSRLTGRTARPRSGGSSPSYSVGSVRPSSSGSGAVRRPSGGSSGGARPAPAPSSSGRASTGRTARRRPGGGR